MDLDDFLLDQSGDRAFLRTGRSRNSHAYSYDGKVTKMGHFRYNPSVIKSELRHAKNETGSLDYSIEPDVRLEKLGFDREFDRNRIMLSYSDMLTSTNHAIDGDYFSVFFKRDYNFTGPDAFIATMEFLAERGIRKFERLFARGNDTVLFTEEYYDELKEKAELELSPLTADVFASRIYLIDKFIWKKDVEPNAIHLSYH